MSCKRERKFFMQPLAPFEGSCFHEMSYKKTPFRLRTLSSDNHPYRYLENFKCLKQNEIIDQMDSTFEIGLSSF